MGDVCCVLYVKPLFLSVDIQAVSAWFLIVSLWCQKLRDRDAISEVQYATHVFSISYVDSDSRHIFSPIWEEVLKSNLLFRERAQNAKFLEINFSFGKVKACSTTFFAEAVVKTQLYHMASIVYNPQGTLIHKLASNMFIYLWTMLFRTAGIQVHVAPFERLPYSYCKIAVLGTAGARKATQCTWPILRMPPQLLAVRVIPRLRLNLPAAVLPAPSDRTPVCSPSFGSSKPTHTQPRCFLCCMQLTVTPCYARFNRFF